MCSPLINNLNLSHKILYASRILMTNKRPVFVRLILPTITPLHFRQRDSVSGYDFSGFLTSLKPYQTTRYYNKQKGI